MIRTGYSFRTAYGHVRDVLSRIQTIGLECAPIADRASTFAFTRFSKAASAASLRPVYGVELGVTWDLNAKKQTLDYWTFLAIDDLVPLHRLLYKATGCMQAEPALRYDQAANAEGLIKITGHRTIFEVPNSDADSTSYGTARKIEPRDDLFVGVSAASSRGFINEAVRRGFNLIASYNNYYPTEADKETYRVMLGQRSDAHSYPQHILSDDEWREQTSRMLTPIQQELVLTNRKEILARCNAKLGKAKLLKPDRPKTLRAMCIDGATRLGCDITREEYAIRLDHELRMIAEKQFEDYFYIVADLVTFARQHMIVGPARGSSAGSLVCYLLGITAIDPIPYGLLFERFIDVTRNDLPDIDIDFSDEQRVLAFKHAEQKYGKQRVARLGTVMMYGPKSIFKAVGASLRIPTWRTNKVLDSLVERSGGDTRANMELEDTFASTDAGKKLVEEYPEIKIATRIEGHPTVSSQHAAGIVLTEDEVMKYVAIDARSGATMCDKKDAQELNLLKIDALGLKQLSIFERALVHIGKPPRSIDGFLEALPLNDNLAFNVLNQQKFSGVFQFTGVTLQSLSKDIHIDKFNDLVNITALARPGPMATGGATSWVQRRIGNEAVTYDHPLLKPYLEETLGIITYQEQVMKIGRELGNLSWADVTALRKAMSQSLGEQYFNQYGDRWKVGAVEKGIDRELANKIWFDMCAFGAWGFNKSHAVAYALVSYWCLWLKAHHPVEFAAATLDAIVEPGKQIAYLRELKAEGVDYIPFDRDHSARRWAIKDQQGAKLLVGPLHTIKHIGPAAVEEILTARERGEPIKKKSIIKRLESAKTPLDSLYPIKDRISQFDLAALGVKSTKFRTVPIKDVQCGVTDKVIIIGVLRKLNPRDENEDVNVAKRGGKILSGPDKSLGMFLRDDTDECFCKISRWDYAKYGAKVLDRGGTKKAIYAVRGTIPPDFRMIRVDMVIFVGYIDEDYEVTLQEAAE